MMIAPEVYVGGLKKKSYLELIKARDRLIRELRRFEKAEMAGDRSDPEWQYCPSPEVRYQVYFEYLAALCKLMCDRYNEEYVCGQRTLRQDVEEKGKVR